MHQVAADTQRAELGLRMQMQRKDLELKDAQINQVNATAEKERAEAANITEKKITEMQTREWIVRGAKELSKKDWIQNIRSQYEDEQSVEDKNDVTYHDDQFGEYNIVYKGTRTQQQRADVLKTIGETNNNEAQAAAAKALANLNNQKALGYWRELQIEMVKGNALATMAAAKKLEAETKKLDFEHKYGYKIGPLQWVNLGKDAVELVIGAVSTFAGKKAATKMTQTVKEVYDKWGEQKSATVTTTTTK